MFSEASEAQAYWVIIKPEVESWVFDQEGWELAQLAVDQTFYTTLGYITDFRNSDAEEVEWLCHWFTVEVTA